MKKHLFPAFLSVLFLSSAGGWAAGPVKSDPVVWKSPKPADPKKLVRLDEKRFEPAGGTNHIDPAWLKPSTNLYVLGPGDGIAIEALGEAPSIMTNSVGPDGKIYYSLLPGTPVWGLTLTQAKQTLEQGLQKYFKTKPELAVNLQSVRSQNVWLLGNVAKPGLYPLQTPLTVLEAISLAGGTLNVPGTIEGVCDLKRSFILRQGQALPVDFERLLRLGDMSQNIYLQADDFVYLRSALIRNVSVLGAVAAPRIVPFSDRISLGAAIMSAGGTIEYAYKSDVAIVRGSLANPRVAKVDVGAILKGKARDVELEAGDIVYVPYVPWRQPAMLLDSMVRNFVRIVSLNEGYRSTVRGASALTPIATPGFAPGPGVPFNPNRGF
jgi:polysaccharide export outer membrane protein